MMKFYFKCKRVIFLILSVIMVFSFCQMITFAEPENTVVTQDEAMSMAILYYYGNAQSEINIDSYNITPLYDEMGNITYYCVDFFNETAEKGYVLISTDTSYALCPEFSYEGASDYYKQSLDGRETIYYTPFSVFEKEKETRRSSEKYYFEDQIVSKTDVVGKRICGSKESNNDFRDLITAGSVPTTNGGIAVFEQSPIDWLRSLGYLSATCSTYGTIEDGMTNSGAMNLMYSYDPGLGYKGLPDGYRLYNLDHCVITAMANVMRYWRPICCPAYPSDYDVMFKSLCQKSDELDYFDPSFATTTNSHSYFSGSASRVLREVNSAYGYVGKTYTAQNSWSFLTNYIGSYSWPVIVSFEPAELGGDFDYVGHAVVAFGYTVMNTDTFGSKATFKFVKVTDGWNQSPRYIAWDVIDYYEFPAIMVTFCPYQ